eukprot:357899-Chlamydomonas_euryale.AAC.3
MQSTNIHPPALENTTRLRCMCQRPTAVPRTPTPSALAASAAEQTALPIAPGGLARPPLRHRLAKWLPGSQLAKRPERRRLAKEMVR